MNSTYVDRILESWLADGPSVLPDRVVDRIVNNVVETDRRVPWWLPGRQTMNRMMLAMGGVAGLVLLLVAGGLLYVGTRSNGGLGAPTATPQPTPTQTAVSVPRMDFAGMPAGRYFDQVNGYRYVFTVPDGWMAYGNGGLLIKGSNFLPAAEDFAGDSPDFAAFGLPTWWGNPADSRYVYTDPCQSSTSAVSTGQTAADLAAALHEIAPMNPSEPDDIPIGGGFTAKHIRLTAPSDVDFSTCDNGIYLFNSGRYSQGPGQVDEYWIFDLPNGTRPLFAMSYMPGTSQEVRDQLTQMVESLTIEAPSRTSS